MQVKSLPLVRLFVACAMGMLCLAESLNPSFLRANVGSWNPYIRLFVALFGVAWFVQAAFLHRQTRERRQS
jgi:hypothetical protein